MTSRTTAITLLLIALTAGAACAQQMDPNAALTMPFAELAQGQGIDAQALAAEVGLPEDADLSEQTGRLLKASGLALRDLQRAMQTLRAAEASGAGVAMGVPEGEPPLEGQSAVEAEAASKDWGKIRLKFILWVVFFVGALLMLMLTKVRPLVRVLMLLAAVAIFGVWLGVEPNAPGTIKDGIMLYAETGVVFLPRLIAFAGFLLMGIIGNKLFCGWCCQFGTLQDAIWHIPTKKWKPPFALSNTFRVGFFLLIAIAALGYGTDILEPIDPFRIFRLGAIGAVIVAAAVLVASVWVYRPWCSFFCPFGLLSWVAERIALTKPRVNLKTCIDCLRCERACPNFSIRGLRRGHKAPQDCFACGTCIRVCPVNAIRWHITPPPNGPELATREESEDDAA